MHRPPSASHEYDDKMIENIELVSMLNKEIVIFGDLNVTYKLDESSSSYWKFISIVANCNWTYPENLD